MSEKKEKIRLLSGLIVSLLLIASIVAFNYFSFSRTENTILEQLKDKQLIETEYAARQIESHVYKVKDELTTLSKFPVMKSLDVSQCSGDMKIIHQSLDSKINSLLRASAEGKITESSTPLYAGYVSVNIADKDYFRVPKETKEAYISGFIREGSVGHVIVSAPMFESDAYTPYPNFKGEFNGALLSIIEISNLYDIYIHPLTESALGDFVLFNEDTGETILNSEGMGGYEQLKAGLPVHETGSYGAITDVFGIKSLFTISHFTVGNELWGIAVLTPVSKVNLEVGKVQTRNLASLLSIILVIAGLLVFVFSLFRSRQQIQAKLEKVSSMLEKFGITVEVESGNYSSSDISPEPGKVYLVKEENEAEAFEIFIGALNRGFAGLGIVREHPDRIREKYNLTKTSLVWLADSKADKAPSANDIGVLLALVSEFIGKSKKCVVLIDRLDYVLRTNDFEDVMKKLYEMKDAVQGSESMIIISVNPSLLQENQMKAIEAETTDIYGKAKEGHAGLSDMELKILQVVNDRNKSGRLVSFIDITSGFNITKPTTRAKINRLVALGLLTIEKHGRYKAIKITSAGRRTL